MPRNCADFERALEDFSEDHAEKKRETQIERKKEEKKKGKKKRRKKEKGRWTWGWVFSPPQAKKLPILKSAFLAVFTHFWDV